MIKRKRNTSSLRTSGYLLYLLLFVCLSELPAQRKNIIFNKLTFQNGLPSNICHKVIQDSSGYIWVATSNGLVRYDGINTKVFTKANDALYSNQIKDIVIDKKHNFWIISNRHLMKFYPTTGIFVDMHDKLNLTRFKILNDLFLDSCQRLWVFEENGSCLVFDTREDKLLKIIDHENYGAEGWPKSESIFLGEDKTGSLWFSDPPGKLMKLTISLDSVHLDTFAYHVNAMAQNAKGELFFGGEKLLMVKTSGKGAFEPQVIDIKSFQGENSRKDFSITSIQSDFENNVWLSTEDDGIKKYYPDENLLKDVPLTVENYKGEISRSALIRKDNKGNLWFSFDNNVLMLYNKFYKDFLEFKHDPTDFLSVSEDIASVFADKNNVFWLTSQNHGINYFDLKKSKFYSIQKDVLNTNTISSKAVRGIYEDDRGYLWLGTQAGIDILNIKNGNLYNKIEGESPTGKNIFDFIKLKENRFFAATVPLVEYSFDYDSTRMIKVREHRPDFISGCRFNSWSPLVLCEDHSGTLWIGTNGEGLFSYNTSGNEDNKACFVQYSANGTEYGTAGGSVWDVFEDSQNRLWIANNGLSMLNEERTKFTHFQHNPTDNTSLSSPGAKHIVQDKNGAIWIATEEGGLNKFIEESNSFQQFNVEAGYPFEDVYAIFEDKKGYFWLSTNSGIKRFNQQNDEVITFSLEDGLLINNFWVQSSHQGKSGNIYFGSSEGVNYFFPDSVILSDYCPPLVFTSLIINNKEVVPNKIYAEKILLNQEIDRIKDLVLESRQNTFSISFAALDFSSPSSIKYRYTVSGITDDWVYRDPENAKFDATLLPSGDYTLAVQSTNADGVWVENTKKIAITILPPWWKSWWAKLLYVHFIVVIGFFVKRIYDVRKNYQFQLEKQKLEVESQKLISRNQIELNKVKTQFFTNISHEFRTPLTLIIGPLEQLFNSVELPAPAKSKISLISRNANRLSRLINQLLDLSKLESSTLKLSLTEGNILEFLKQNFESFEDLAEKNNIKYSFYSDSRSNGSVIAENLCETAIYDSDKLEKIMYNLISNAFKFTPRGGEIKVEAYIENQKYLNVVVSDTGVGIPKEKLPYIFDRFYQTGNSARDQAGTGIGLSLAKELIELHEGEISVKSEEGEGTVFSLTIPISKENYSQVEILKAETNSSFPEVVPQEMIYSYQNPMFVEEASEVCHDISILVVDDNPDIVEFVRSILERDYQLLYAFNGKQALDVANSKVPDLIISDLVMPEMDGNELCNKLKSRESTSHIPIILLTAISSEDSQIQGLKLGAIDYITKPFNEEILKHKIKSILNQRDKIRDNLKKSIYSLTPIEELNSQDDKLFQKIIEIINRNIENECFCVEDLSKTLELNRTQLYRKVKAMTDLSVSDFIRSIKLKRAAELLLSKKFNVSEVAFMTGFKSQPNFTRAFTTHFGKSPTEFVHSS